MEPIARQWCRYHNIHQDDPRHDYTYPVCEKYLRPSIRREDWMARLRQFIALVRTGVIDYKGG